MYSKRLLANAEGRFDQDIGEDEDNHGEDPLLAAATSAHHVRMDAKTIFFNRINFFLYLCNLLLLTDCQFGLSGFRSLIALFIYFNFQSLLIFFLLLILCITAAAVILPSQQLFLSIQRTTEFPTQAQCGSHWQR